MTERQLIHQGGILIGYFMCLWESFYNELVEIGRHNPMVERTIP